MNSSLVAIREHELLRALTEEELTRLGTLCSEFVVVEDAIFFTEGRAASHLYLVTEGRIALQKFIRPPHGTRSRRTTIAVCRPGDVLGWSALVEPYIYTLSATAWETSRLIRIDAKMLRRALDLYPQMGYKVMKALSSVMSRRLQQTTEALTSEREVSYAGLRVQAPVDGYSPGRLAGSESLSAPTPSRP